MVTSPEIGSREWVEAGAPEVIASAFGWERIDAPGSNEFFARDQQGRALWLKARQFRRWDQVAWEWSNPSPQYDDFIGILVFITGEIPTVIHAPRQTVERLKHVNKGVCRLRWSDETRAAVEYLYDH